MIGRNKGDEVQGERIICFFRKRDRDILIPMTGGHRGIRLRLWGLPARAIVEKPVEWVE